MKKHLLDIIDNLILYAVLGYSYVILWLFRG